MSVARKVVLQLDYFMCSQFAGVALGLRNGLYKKAGVDLHWLPPCTPGDEAKIVSESFRKDRGQTLWVGTMEQNTLLPAIAMGHQVKAVSAMFNKSPLCLAGLPNANLSARLANGESLRVGAHVDTVDLMQRIMPKAAVVELPRVSKLESLRDGSIDAVQAYDVMETLRLQHELGAAPEIVRLEDCAPGVALGYGQVIFAPSQALEDSAHRQLLRDFITCTFLGWRQACRDPAAAAEAVMELQDEKIDHWVHSKDFTERSVKSCCEYVQPSGQPGVIDEARWRQAEEWLMKRDTLDASIWPSA